VLEDSNGYILLVTHVGKDGSVYAQDDPVQLSPPCVRVIREFDKSLAATTEFDFPEFNIREPSEVELQRFKKAYGEDVVIFHKMETIPAPPELPDGVV